MTRDSQTADTGLAVLGGIGIGAALMYLLDPDRGTARRAHIRDQLASTARSSGDALDVAARDLRNRTRGLVAETRARLTPEDVTDEVLVGRVRAELGRVVSHPGSVIVTASEGNVTLSGPILVSEVDRLLESTSRVRGVRDVISRLEVHESAEGVPGLQGGIEREGGRGPLRQENWSPTERLLVGAAGGILALWGARRHDALGTTLGLAGIAMLSRGATGTPLSDLAGGTVEVARERLRDASDVVSERGSPPATNFTSDAPGAGGVEAGAW